MVVRAGDRTQPIDEEGDVESVQCDCSEPPLIDVPNDQHCAVSIRRRPRANATARGGVIAKIRTGNLPTLGRCVHLVGHGQDVPTFGIVHSRASALVPGCRAKLAKPFKVRSERRKVSRLHAFIAEWITQTSERPQTSMPGLQRDAGTPEVIFALWQ
jgi:hypothetical protein